MTAPLRILSAPAALPVSMSDARAALRIEDADTSLDGQITRWVKGITASAEHEIGRALIRQTWRLTLDRFPELVGGAAGPIELDRPPILSVVAIRYLDEQGVQQTLDPQDYFVDMENEPGYIVPGPGRSWPTTFERINAVTVDYECGFGDDESAIPENVKLYILARLAEQIDPATKAERSSVQSEFVNRLLDACRVY